MDCRSSQHELQKGLPDFEAAFTFITNMDFILVFVLNDNRAIDYYDNETI